MESLTIAWYVLTVLIVIIFVVIIVLTQSKCIMRPPQRSVEPVKPVANRRTAPLTPAPAYSEFAPPSYQEAVRQSRSSTANITSAIFVITVNETRSPCQQQQQHTAIQVASLTATTTTLPNVVGVSSMGESPA